MRQNQSVPLHSADMANQPASIPDKVFIIFVA